MISVREKSKDLVIIKEALEAAVGRPAYVSFDEEKLEGSLTRLPDREELSQEVDESYIVEFYNKNYNTSFKAFKNFLECFLSLQLNLCSYFE